LASVVDVRPKAAGRHSLSRGQSMVEFALVVPIFLLIFFGVVDGMSLEFSVASAQFAADDASKLVAQLGNSISPDADQSTVTKIRNSPLATVSLVRVTEVDIYQLQPDANGNLVATSLSNKYKIDGTVVFRDWDPSVRNVTNESSDFVGVRIHYTYLFHQQLLPNALPSDLTATSETRIEPQAY
jgi:Flp pilus assembly protein TadG